MIDTSTETETSTLAAFDDRSSIRATQAQAQALLLTLSSIEPFDYVVVIGEASVARDPRR